MSSSVIPIERHETLRTEQLTLLSVPPEAELKEVGLAPSSVHARFRLSESTRTRGLAHVAEIRRQLAESQAQRESTAVPPLSPRRTRAA